MKISTRLLENSLVFKNCRPCARTACLWQIFSFFCKDRTRANVQIQFCCWHISFSSCSGSSGTNKYNLQYYIFNLLYSWLVAQKNDFAGSVCLLHIYLPFFRPCIAIVNRLGNEVDVFWMAAEITSHCVAVKCEVICFFFWQSFLMYC